MEAIAVWNETLILIILEMRNINSRRQAQQHYYALAMNIIKKLSFKYESFSRFSRRMRNAIANASVLLVCKSVS